MPYKSKQNSEVLKNKDEFNTHFDFKALFKKMGGNDIFISEILALGKKDLTENYPLLQEAFVNKDIENVEVIVHRLRGTASAIGFNLLYDYLTLFENDIKSNVFDNQKFDNIKNEVDYLHSNILV